MAEGTARRDWRVFLVARAASLTGSALTALAIPVVLFERTGSPFVTGLASSIRPSPTYCSACSCCWSASGILSLDAASFLISGLLLLSVRTPLSRHLADGADGADGADRVQHGRTGCSSGWTAPGSSDGPRCCWPPRSACRRSRCSSPRSSARSPRWCPSGHPRSVPGSAPRSACSRVEPSPGRCSFPAPAEAQKRRRGPGPVGVRAGPRCGRGSRKRGNAQRLISRRPDL
jgi:hypothetical protein